MLVLPGPQSARGARLIRTAFTCVLVLAVGPAVLGSPGPRRAPHRPLQTLTPGGGVQHVAFSPDGKLLAACGEHGLLWVWHTATWSKPRAIRAHADLAMTVAFTRDGRLLATAGHDGSIKLWNTTTWQATRTIRAGHRIYGAAFSPDGKCVAAGGQDERVEVWDTATGRRRLTLTGNSYGVYSVAYSPDGRLLAAGCFDATAKVWDARTGRRLRTLAGFEGGVHTVAFSPDGRLLAAGSEDGSAGLWRVATWRRLRTLRTPGQLIFSAALSPNGRFLAAGTREGWVWLWDTGSGRRLAAFPAHSDYTESVAFSPDGRTLATGSPDGRVKLWSWPAGGEAERAPSAPQAPPAVGPAIARFLGVRVGVNTVPDLERRLGPGLAVTGGHPGGARVWRVGRSSLVIRADGFNYTRRGEEIIEQLSVGYGPYAEKLRRMPVVRMPRRRLALFGRIYAGMTLEQARRAVAGLMPPPREHGGNWEWTVEALARRKSDAYDRYHTWTAAVEFRNGRVVLLDLSCS